MDKTMQWVERVFSFLTGFILATLIMTIIFIISTHAAMHTNSSSRMRYVPARSILISP